MELSLSKDSPGDIGDAIDREDRPFDEGSSEMSFYNQRCNSPTSSPFTSEAAWTREAEKEMGYETDCESFEGIVNSSLYPPPPPPPAPGAKTTLPTIPEDVQMSAIVQEQGAMETPTGADGNGSLQNSKDPMTPNSSPDKGKAIDKKAHPFYNGCGDWSEVKRSRDVPIELSSIMEHVKSSYINQEYKVGEQAGDGQEFGQKAIDKQAHWSYDGTGDWYKMERSRYDPVQLSSIMDLVESSIHNEYKEGEQGDDGQEFWQKCWDTDRADMRPKDQSTLRECNWEKLTEDTPQDTPLTISGLQLRMLEFKRRATELDLDDKDYAQSQAIMKKFETKAIVSQIRAQELNHHIALNEKAIGGKENRIKEIQEDSREGKILLAIRRAIRKKADDIREALENKLDDIREKLCEDMEKLLSLESAVQAKPDPDEPLLDDELALFKEVGDENEFEVAMKESEAKLEALSLDITDPRRDVKEKKPTVQDTSLVVLRTKLMLDELREDVSVHGVRIRRLVRIIQEADEMIDELRSV